MHGSCYASLQNCDLQTVHTFLLSLGLLGEPSGCGISMIEVRTLGGRGAELDWGS